MGKLYEYVLTTVPPSLDETINQPTRDLYKRYRERVELRSGQSDVLEVVRPFATLLRLVGAAAFFIEIAFLLSLAAWFFQTPRAVPIGGFGRSDILPGSRGQRANRSADSCPR